MDKIIVRGARENNLKNVNVELPKNKLIVMTGLSGSGKSSLAFDTIYQEGQRRYVESLSTYARQFLGGMNKPDVDSIEGLSPAISIDQKSTSNNPRSTVGTVTEIYDYLRVLYARIGIPYCPIHHEPIQAQTIDEMVNFILKLGSGSKIQIMAPIVTNSKGTHKKILEEALKDGFVRAKIDGKIYDLDDEIDLDKNVKHNIYIVIDRIIVKDENKSRIFESVELCIKKADGKVVIENLDKNEEVILNSNYTCKYCGYSIPSLEPSMFSFNSPLGACPDCAGLGFKQQISEALCVDGDKSINEGAIVPIKNQEETNIQRNELKTVCKFYDIDMDIPFNKLERKKQEYVLYGSSDVISFNITSSSGRVNKTNKYFEGILTNLERRFFETTSEWIKEWLEKYMVETTCQTCRGKRLKEAILNVFIEGKNIYDLTSLPINEFYDFIYNLKLDEEKTQIASLLLQEIKSRLHFLMDVGLNYLTLSRTAGSLSGGEAQRIRLATQIGSPLTGILYVLDEPSIGLHQRDNDRLINSLEKMRDLGNTLIVVEHDDEIMRRSDYIVDVGPYAGIHGGEIVASGTPEEIMANDKSITGRFLSGKEKILVPKKRREGNGKYLEVINARCNNLKGIDVKFPLNSFICVTGVSGSGKSSLVNEVLMKNIKNLLYKVKEDAGACDKILGVENIEKVVEISQDPIGRSPRSNPATYTQVFDDIRDLFSQTNDAKMHGFDKGRFSFNVRGGRCEACSGDGVKRISMQFLPDVYVPCNVCKGKRYNSETLEIKFKGKNISDVLDMTIDEAYDLFINQPKIKAKLETLKDVGLGYMKLGQPAPTLSGGEAQRVKLASELQKRITGKTLYILDEPTTGLHAYDVRKIIEVLQRIVDLGGSVIVIEHNLDMIKCADYIIDLGPEGGNGGGKVIALGTPEEVSKNKKSFTGEYLKKVL
ncbi:MAG: excinuclease ABC subunit UvrA [Acholeplasmatales bacterium]|nr:excinuclease ABC subunit UvrA [Acholeplasmatales bacterium]